MCLFLLLRITLNRYFNFLLHTHFIMILDKELGALASRAEEMGLTRVLPREAKETCRNDQYSDTCEKPNISTGEIMLILFIARYL